MKAQRRRHHFEHHRSGRIGWLRAAVLGSNDAIVSTAALMMGVGSTDASTRAVFVAGVAGLFAGAMSMAVGEYVSVSSQRDAEEADIAIETAELAEAPDAELLELTNIYVKRGLDKQLAHEVAKQLTAHDQLAAHLRDELGIEAHKRARPLQAAVVSAVSFSMFALLPIAGLVAAPAAYRLVAIAVVTLASLAALGVVGARLGGAAVGRAALRVTVGGGLALAVTAGIGRLLGAMGI
ncbi:MAG TPA: VIT family protein [Kofleriaceae bacterium]|nr:VIT family protein [Kofleriaceae bacterium]